MNCKEFEKGVFLYEELSALQKKDMDDHSKDCLNCSKLTDEVFQSQAYIKSISALTPQAKNPHQLTQRVMNAIKKERRVRWFDDITSCLDHYFVRLAFGTVSLSLILFFVYELPVGGDMPRLVKNNTIEIKQGPVLDMNKFSSSFLEWRKSKQTAGSISGYAYYKSESGE